MIAGIALDEVAFDAYFLKDNDMWVALPLFMGWTAISQDEQIMKGDVLVNPLGLAQGYGVNDYPNPDKGYHVDDRHIGKTLRTSGITKGFWVYRPIDAVPVKAEAPVPNAMDDLWVVIGGETLAPPVFPGWTAMPRATKAKRGDVALMPIMGSTPAVNGVKMIAGQIGRDVNGIGGPCYILYRPDGGTRLPGNPLYADPLPLP